jgi:lipoate-protein ligase A
MTEPIRLIVDPPQGGSWNMSVDRALLESAAAAAGPTLRIYQWQPATISLGYFQAAGHRRSHPASRACPMVRRATGGGAIVHDVELTYSLALPRSSPWSSNHAQLFSLVHRTIIDCLRSLGVSGCQVFESDKRETRDEPFLCFQRRASGDVVLNGSKIVGSAQRRLKDALLQHGSVLIGQSAAAPELPGLNQLVDNVQLNFGQLLDSWPRHLANSFDWSFHPAEMTPDEKNNASLIEKACFGNLAWTQKR